jgi:hypothetical protein
MEHRPHAHPASPPLRREQLLSGPPQTLAVLAAALGALLLRQQAR